MRGTHGCGAGLAGQTGIIPADAGNTATWTDHNGVHQDHPRGCGEHLGFETVVTCRMGSSPRMRGTHAGKTSRML